MPPETRSMTDSIDARFERLMEKMDTIFGQTAMSGRADKQPTTAEILAADKARSDEFDKKFERWLSGIDDKLRRLQASNPHPVKEAIDDHTPSEPSQVHELGSVTNNTTSFVEDCTNDAGEKSSPEHHRLVSVSTESDLIFEKKMKSVPTVDVDSDLDTCSDLVMAKLTDVVEEEVIFSHLINNFSSKLVLNETEVVEGKETHGFANQTCVPNGSISTCSQGVCQNASMGCSSYFTMFASTDSYILVPAVKVDDLSVLPRNMNDFYKVESSLLCRLPPWRDIKGVRRCRYVKIIDGNYVYDKGKSDMYDIEWYGAVVEENMKVSMDAVTYYSVLAALKLNKYELLSYSLPDQRPSLPPENDLKIDVSDDVVVELENGVDSLFESFARFHSHLLSVGQNAGKIRDHTEIIQVMLKQVSDVLLQWAADETRHVNLTDVGIHLSLLVNIPRISVSNSVADDPKLWVHESAGPLCPVFSFLEIDQAAWHGLEETAGSATAKSHVGPFLRLLAEDNNALSAEMIERETALAKTVDAMASSMASSPSASKSKQDKHHEYENKCREKFSTVKMQENTEAVDDVPIKSHEIDNCYVHKIGEVATSESCRQLGNELVEEVTLLSYQKEVAILYELLSACLVDLRDEDKKCTQTIKVYDARHRADLRLLTTWFDLKWIKMEAIETMVAGSAMALKKEQEAKEEESQTQKNNWAKWKRGGIIGAAAITGGTLMAITGGLAAPATAAGFSALAPTLGTIIPVIGASEFTAVASAAGTVAGSIVVAASFGAAGAGLSGTKMAKMIGGVDEHTMIFMEYEFEKKNIGAILVFDPGGGIIFGAAIGIAYPHMQGSVVYYGHTKSANKSYEIRGHDFSLSQLASSLYAKHLIALAPAATSHWICQLTKLHFAIGDNASAQQFVYNWLMMLDAHICAYGWTANREKFQEQFIMFSSPRPPEVADLEDKVNFMGRGMLRNGIIRNIGGAFVSLVTI